MILRAVAEPGSAGAVEQLGEFADVTDADHYVQVIQICPVGRSLDPPFRLLGQCSMPTCSSRYARGWVKRVIPILDMLRKRGVVWRLLPVVRERHSTGIVRLTLFVMWKYYLCNDFIIHTRD